MIRFKKIIIAVCAVLLFCITGLAAYAAGNDDFTHYFVFKNKNNEIISLNVSKTVESSNVLYPADKSKEFTFTLYLDGEKAAERPYFLMRNGKAVYDGKEYELVYESGSAYINVNGINTDTKYFTSEKGEFNLKHGESALFVELDEGVKATVEEQRTEKDAEGGVYIPENNQYTIEHEIEKNGTSIDFVNTYYIPTDITITKKVYRLSEGKTEFDIPFDTEPEFTFKITDADGQPFRKGMSYKVYTGDDKENYVIESLKSTDGTFKLCENQSAVFEGLAKGSDFKVTELFGTGDLWRLKFGEAEREGSVGSTNEEDMTFTNTCSSFLVKKTIAEDSERQPLEDETFTFYLKKNSAPQSGALYYVYNSKDGTLVTEEAQKTQEDGSFVLAADQTAVFIGLRGNEFEVSEATSTDSSYQMSKLVKDKNSSGEIEKWKFENKLLDKTAGLYVTKNVSDVNGLFDKTEFTFVLKKKSVEPGGAFSAVLPADKEAVYFIRYPDGSEGSKQQLSEGGKFTLKNGETAVFERVNKNYAYKVEEIINNDVPDYKAQFKLSYFNADTSGRVEISSDVFDSDTAESIESAAVMISKGEPSSIVVTNTFDYSFDFRVKKLMHIDKITGTEDANQRNLFRIQHFVTKTDMENGIVADEFFTDFSCTTEAEDTIEGYDLKTGESVIRVKKAGWYKITEVTEWSGTDYDYIKGSNIYSGGLADAPADSYVDRGDNDYYVAFCIEKVYDSNSDIIENLPTAQFSNIESPYAFESSQSFKENVISK